ncbi:unnamed protein product [Caenorhabditis angaria]|uniref:Peptidase M13 N-terminal domain-containing protein n=1 Tax=Caenorhabditis angaria TaxID=860376 RepID=A0A9P1MS50_9PELO|nr:unnamed protein product [Caenorhabditis angaria]
MVDLEMEIKGPISKSSEKIKGFKKSIFTAVLFLAIVFLFYAKNQGLIGSDQVRSSKPNNDEEIPKNEIPRSEEDVYKNKNICETRECKILARKMKSHMNPKIDPCDDFYESICGNYPENLKSEIFENKNENYKEFATFMKTYKPITRAEKIAMKVMEKCMDSSEERKQFDTSFWDNLQNHSLTDVLIEAVKINPIDTGFFEE